MTGRAAPGPAKSRSRSECARRLAPAMRGQQGRLERPRAGRRCGGDP
jgi:hypothetical protein